jgi:hypothetical protein
MSLLSPEEISLLSSDSKYRNYASSIEKALKNFEQSTEWADLIASLGKLKKVLQTSPKYSFIPKRVSICKRLAQCLHPALPSGVHLKTLEVYTVLFQNIGSDNLSRDIFLYSSGLFPLLANASLIVKPVLLGIYETYFLPLKQALRPCLVGFILAVLPGLEEGSDFTKRTFNLLNSIAVAQSSTSSSSSSSNLFSNSPSMTTINSNIINPVTTPSSLTNQSNNSFNYNTNTNTVTSTTTTTTTTTSSSSVTPDSVNNSQSISASVSSLASASTTATTPASTVSSSTNNLVSFAIYDKYFYTCLWSAVISQSSIRFPAIQYMIANFDMKAKYAVITT